MTRTASKAPGWALEGLRKVCGPMLGPDAWGNPPRGATAAARVRYLLGLAGDDGVQRHAVAVLERVGSGLAVELLDGRRGWVSGAHLPGPGLSGEDSVTWRAVTLGWAERWRDQSGAVAAVVDVEPFDGGPRVMVEVERVTIPAPARGEHDGSLERFMAAKRGGHEPVNPYKRGRWDKPHLPALPSAPRVTIARPGKLGPGARVQAVEIRPGAQVAHDVVRYVGLVLDRMASGDYAVQRLEESAAGPYGSVTALHGSRLEPIEGERGQYA